MRIIIEHSKITSLQTGEKNLVILLQRIICTSKLIKSGNIANDSCRGLNSSILEIYRTVVEEYSGLGPNHWISKKFSDDKKVVDAYRVIEEYIKNVESLYKIE